MKNKFKKIGFFLTTTMCLMSNISTASAAGWPVSDLDLLAYLSNSAAGGVVTDNGGVISLLNQVESDLSHISSQNTNLAENAGKAQDLRDKLALTNQLNIGNTPDNNACYSISAANSGGSASGATSSASTSYQNTSKNSVLQAVSNGPEAKNFMYSRAGSGLCSADDAKYKRGGCSSQGEYPKADVDAGSISGAPLTSSDIASGNTRKDYYTADQAKMTNDFLVKNLTSNLPIKDIDDQTKSLSTNGVLFGAELSSYQAKSLLAQKANTDQIALKTEITSNLNSEQQKIWDSSSSQWATWFGFSNPKPTEWNLIKAQVYSRYADNQWLADTATMDEKTSNREILRMQALALKMQLEQMSLQMTNNQLLAAILGNSIQPVTYDSLSNLRSKLESQ